MKLTAAQKQRPATIMILDAAKVVPSNELCNAVYVALADKRDIRADDLEKLANRLGQLAWEMQRNAVV